MLISGFILTSIFDGKKGILDQLKNAVRVRSNYKSYLAVILILVISNLATLLTAFLIFGDKPSLYMFKYEPLGIFILLIFFVLLGGPIFEDLFGLRSFALPKLLEKYTRSIVRLLSDSSSEPDSNCLVVHSQYIRSFRSCNLYLQL